MKSRPVLIGNAILAALQILTGAAVLSDVLGTTVFGLFVIAVAAVQVGFNTYVQGTVVPYQDVAAFQNSSGEVVAGPAAGVTNGKSVDVVSPTMLATNIRADSISSGTITGGKVEGRRKRDEGGRMDVLQALLIVFVVVVIVVLVAWLIPGR